MSKGEETRQRIVAQAAAMFNQHGFDGSSLSELMKATGLEKGGIYRHFSSKEELAAEAFDYAWKAAWDARMRDLGSIANSVDKLKQIIANCVRRRSSVPGGCPLLNTAIDADDGNPILRASALKALGVWRAHLAGSSFCLSHILGGRQVQGLDLKQRHDSSAGRAGNCAHASSIGVIMRHSASTSSRRVNSVASPRIESSSRVSYATGPFDPKLAW
jgi:AcrR family transcriptional regulator